MTGQKTLTRNQCLVLGRLRKAQKPLSAYDILDQLRSEGLKAPLQVYRALGVLTKKGRAHRLESLNAFVACASNECNCSGLSAFAICDGCGKVDEFTDLVLRQRLQGWADTKGFSATHSVVEMHGTCVVCSRS
jgi:Fur family transcriptional regulator, zinc uptake regulator